MFIKASLYGVLTLLSTTSAFALTCDTGSSSTCAASATAASDCENLGFSKDSPNGCKHYLYCPFDTSYKRCASLDCTSYTLSSCPANGYCESCKAGGHNYYTLDGCNTGYVKSGNSCPANPCTGYALTSCPTGASSCSNCLSGKTNKYKVNGCKNGYTASGNTCVAAACSGYTLTSCPTGASSCSTCLSGKTNKYKVNGCKNGYVLSGNSCPVRSCPSGYSTSTTSCSSGYTLSTNGYSGSKPCRRCVAKSCSGYSLSSCPSNGKCSSCKSGSSYKYKLNSCNSGYEKVGNKCVKVNTCSEDDGWVYVPTDVYKKATAQNGAHPECYSYGGYNFIKYGDTCESNGKTYYQDC